MKKNIRLLLQLALLAPMAPLVGCMGVISDEDEMNGVANTDPNVGEFAAKNPAPSPARMASPAQAPIPGFLATPGSVTASAPVANFPNQPGPGAAPIAGSPSSPTPPAMAGQTAAPGPVPTAMPSAPAVKAPAPTTSLTPAPSGTLVPLYTSPAHPSWTQIVEGKMANPTVPVLAVVNPSNGPGSGLDATYQAGIRKLTAAGIKVLGYVATGYSARSQAAVRADMDHWRSWYPNVAGIFFDEMSRSAGKEDYYRGQDVYAKALGFTYTVGNPGSDTTPSYVGVVDMILVYENAGLVTPSNWHANYPRERFGIIPYSIPSLDSNYLATVKKNVGFIYLTNDTLPNPWDTLPPYFGTLLADLAKG